MIVLTVDPTNRERKMEEIINKEDPVPLKDPCLDRDNTPVIRDICVYCHADNGIISPETGRGVYRIGWDCYNCNSN